MEVLLVVVIILIGTALSLPSFARAMRGAKLRASVRSMISLHRYARATSVLKQRSFAIYVYHDTGKLELVSLVPESGGGEGFDGDEDMAPVDDPFSPNGGYPVSYTVEVELERNLNEGVTVTGVELDVEDQTDDEVSWINYYPNGMCDACTMVFVDEQDREAELTLDAFSGRVEVEYE